LEIKIRFVKISDVMFSSFEMVQRDFLKLSRLSVLFHIRPEVFAVTGNIKIFSGDSHVNLKQVSDVSETAYSPS
jgi:hypothetical protein